MGVMWDVWQDGRITDAELTAQNAYNKVNIKSVDIDELKRQISKMVLINQALWELLREHANLTDDQLLQKVEEIDSRDGTKDGRIGHQIVQCPNCKRNCNTQNDKCMYCGTKLVKPNAVE